MTSVTMRIAYYITGHGYGHAIRSSTIANALPLSVHVTFKTAIPVSFFQEELLRPFNHVAAAFDCGCLQHDWVSINIPGTLATYMSIAENNRHALNDEVEWCRQNGIDGIISDITPFAFDIAHHAGIPSIAVTNFTWFDIYRDYTAAFPHFLPCLDEIRTQYRSASLCLALHPSLSMNYFPEIRPVPVVGRKGRALRTNLLDRFTLDSRKRIGLVYTGNFGFPAAVWRKLESFTSWEFFGLNDLPGNPSNFHRIGKKEMFYPDLIASADCVISKLGYGVVAECMINATPVIYLPRRDFAEYPMLEKAVEEWGGGIRLSHHRFLCLDWESALERSTALKPLPDIPSDGASVCACAIVDFISSSMPRQERVLPENRTGAG